MLRQYNFEAITRGEAGELDGKVVTIEVWADRAMGETERSYSRVRVMYPSYHSYLLVLADGDPGPAAKIQLHRIRTVEVHES